MKRFLNVSVLACIMTLLLVTIPGCGPGTPDDEVADNGVVATNDQRPKQPVPADERPEEQPQLANSVFGAILADDEARAMELIEQGAPVNARNEREVTVLHFAVRASMVELTELLLRYGADPNAQVPTMNHTPMHWASRTGAHDRPNIREIVDLLLEYGADINFADTEGRRPISYADDPINNEAWREFMISRGATRD